MSLDEVVERIEQIAKEGTGVDKMRALRYLASQESGNVILPPPLSDREQVDRLKRIIRFMGWPLVRVAVEETFGLAAAQEAEEKPPAYTEDSLPADMRAKITRIRDVPGFYKLFPDLKRTGFPRGYPVGEGDLVRGRWLRALATRLACERLSDDGATPPLPLASPTSPDLAPKTSTASDT